MVNRLAGDPDLPRLVGRHVVDLHATSGCAGVRRQARRRPAGVEPPVAPVLAMAPVRAAYTAWARR